MEYSCSINALKNGLWYALLLFVAYVLFQYWRILKKKNLGILIYDIVLLWRVGYCSFFFLSWLVVACFLHGTLNFFFLYCIILQWFSSSFWVENSLAVDSYALGHKMCIYIYIDRWIYVYIYFHLYFHVWWQ